MKRTILITIILGTSFAGSMPAPICNGYCRGTHTSIYNYAPGPSIFQQIANLFQGLF